MDSEGFSVFGAFEGYQWGQAYIHPCDGNRGNSKGEPLWLWVIQQGQAASLLAHDFPQESLVCYTCRRGWRGKRGAVLYAPEEVRISRAVWRDASSRELIEKRIRSQMDDEEKRKYADFVIVNDGETPLIPQVLELIGSLSEKMHYLLRK